MDRIVATLKYFYKNGQHMCSQWRILSSTFIYIALYNHVEHATVEQNRIFSGKLRK